MIATSENPSTTHHFRFGTRTDAALGVGDVVRVEGEGRVIYGLVTAGVAWNAMIGEEQPDLSRGVLHREIAVRSWDAVVLRRIPVEPIQPVPPTGSVHPADDGDVRLALGMETYSGEMAESAIPIGVFASGSQGAPVLLDPDFLIGPEAAHLNVTGVSGLATKTSAVTFLLSALFQKFPANKGSIAAICFNVKGPDLAFLDQPATLSKADLALWHRLDLKPVPFTDFTLYAPFRADGVNLNTLRTHPDLRGAVEPLVWGLREVLDFAELLLNRDDIDAKAGAFIDFLRDQVVGKRFAAPELSQHSFEVTSFADLDHFFKAIFEHLERQRGGEIWRTHHAATIRKVRNRLGNIGLRSRGLVTDDGDSNDLPWGKFRDRSVQVIDLAGVEPLAQELVFARVISRLREELERRSLGVDQVVVVVDELNKYAPSDGPDTYVRQTLVDLSERGRYLGLVLFSAQQFRSQVLRRVIGNAATSLLGRMDADELALPAYATLPPAIKARLASLPKGELLLRHPHFIQPVFIRFPRPASLSGREGLEKFPPAADLPFVDAVLERLRQLDPNLKGSELRDAVDDRPEVEVRRAVARVIRDRPGNVLEYFRSCLKRTIRTGLSETPQAAPLSVHPEDPFAPY